MNQRVEPSYLAKLQHNTTNIRNICILAHIDHGKTTLSDSLVCSNGLISPKLAGKLRFLDSQEDEQARGITMHSSAISLLYRQENPKKETDATNASEDYLINLVDSPGHIDFSSDVSTATRLCDGALIIVDVLEGLCTQTHAVLHKALKERMRPCLVLNKVDRLVLELQLTPTEAFHHLRRVLEAANALASSLLNSELIILRELSAGRKLVDEKISNIGDDVDEKANAEEERLISSWNFAPEKGNVIFASAYDCWGFSTGKFATIWAQKLGVSRSVLLQYLFEDYSFNSKTKKVVKCSTESDVCSVPMFASMVLEPIWQLYITCVKENNPTKASKMAARGMGIELPPRELNVREPRLTLQAILRRWLPLPDAVLRMVVRSVPSPIVAQAERLSTLFSRPVLRSTDNPVSLRAEAVQTSVRNCRTDDEADVIVYVAKMTEVRRAELSAADVIVLEKTRQAAVKNGDDPATSSTDEAEGAGSAKKDAPCLMALARVFSGTLRRNSRIFVLGHRHDPRDLQSATEETETPATVTAVPLESFGLYMCFGPSVIAVEEVPAGNIVGIVGIQDIVLKTATLSSTWMTDPMVAISFQGRPLVRVAVEPASHRDLARLERGLERLYQYDPVVEVGIDDTGQHTVSCLGELHLEQCLKALSERFAGCVIKASAPLVSFRETVALGPVSKDYSAVSQLPPPWKDTGGLKLASCGTYSMVSGSRAVGLTLRCTALTMEASAALEEAGAATGGSPDDKGSWRRVLEALAAAVTKDSALLALSSAGAEAEVEFLSRVVALGPKGVGCNLLVLAPTVAAHVWELAVPENDDESRSGGLLGVVSRSGGGSSDELLKLTDFVRIWDRLNSSVTNAFQNVTASGPIMQEPMHGVVFVVESIAVTAAVAGLTQPETNALLRGSPECFGSDDSGSSVDAFGSLQSGQLISEVRDAFRVAMLACPLRIVEPVYACSLQCDQSQLGSLYAVLSKRRGTVMEENIIEGTSLFVLGATLPVSESFGFAQELLKKTSGAGTTPQLSFSHWAEHEDDPFWKPTTEEEIEDFGSLASEPNQARSFIDSVRKRKGLPIEEKIVVHAEKQRTLTKMK